MSAPHGPMEDDAFGSVEQKGTESGSGTASLFEGSVPGAQKKATGRPRMVSEPRSLQGEIP